MLISLYKKLFSYICGRPVVFVCVGTDLVGGDCLGPLVGQLLREANVPAFVYGTLDSPVSALNVDAIGEFVRKNHPGHIIVAIDSAVGGNPDKGHIFVSKSALRPGSADGKDLSTIGDVAVTAVTCCHAPGDKEFSLVRLGFVYSLAKKLTQLLSDCLCHSLYYSTNRLSTVKLTPPPSLQVKIL